MKAVCIYLGANLGKNQLIKEAIVEIGKEIAHRKLTLIYGGSSLGMMGLLAKTVKNSGGKVIGVITHHLREKEEFELSTLLDELHLVDTMQTRKRMMQHLADFFIVLPGGLGTLEEALETWNAIKIGELKKKIGFLNSNGYFDGLFSFIDSCRESGFLTQEHQSIPIVSSHIRNLIEQLIAKEVRQESPHFVSG